MFEQFIKKPHVVSRLKKHCHKSFLEDYLSYLNSKGYAINTAQVYLRNVEHFMNWLSPNKNTKPQITQKTINKFIIKHLPACSCTTPKPCDLKTVRASLKLLLHFKGNNKTHKTPSTDSHIEIMIERYNDYLKDICGLTEATRYYHRRYAVEFLNRLFKSKKLDFQSLTPSILRRYINRAVRNYKKSSIGVLINSLRRFFKFLQFSGDIDSTLISALPKIYKWKLSAIPTCLQNTEIDKIISVFNQETAIGKRNYAIARCLIDLGLRCSEVANLQLDNIDWRLGILYLPKNKVRKEDALPLTTSLTKALANYLRYGRPATKERFIFVYHRAPFGFGITSETVRSVMRRAYKETGLPQSLTGTHILRRTLATRLLNNGSSLKDIADILSTDLHRLVKRHNRLP